MIRKKLHQGFFQICKVTFLIFEKGDEKKIGPVFFYNL